MRNGLFAFRICCIAFSPLLLAQVQLEFGRQAAPYRNVLQLRDGNRLLVGSVPRATGSETGPSRIALTFLGDRFDSAYDFGGGGSTVPRAAALDPHDSVLSLGGRARGQQYVDLEHSIDGARRCSGSQGSWFTFWHTPSISCGQPKLPNSPPLGSTTSF